MRATLISIAWRSAVCACFTYAAWRSGGPIPAVLSLPLAGVLLARPLIELAGDLFHGVQSAAYRGLEGRYYVFQGTPVQVMEDETHRRWVRAADVRRIVGSGVSDAALARLYPDGWRTFGRPPQPHFSDEALLMHLDKGSSAVAGKFRWWVEREIAYPARRVRQRKGIHVPASDSAMTQP